MVWRYCMSGESRAGSPTGPGANSKKETDRKKETEVVSFDRTGRYFFARMPARRRSGAAMQGREHRGRLIPAAAAMDSLRHPRMSAIALTPEERAKRAIEGWQHAWTRDHPSSPAQDHQNRRSSRNLSLAVGFDAALLFDTITILEREYAISRTTHYGMKCIDARHVNQIEPDNTGKNPLAPLSLF